MKTISSILFLSTIILTAIYFGSIEKIKTSAASKKPAAEKRAYGHLPLSFEPNAGQTDEQVKFLSRGPGYALFLTEAEAVMRLKANNCPAEEKNCENKSGVLRIGFDGANRQPHMSGVNEQAGKSNYLNLDGTGKAITGVTNFERVQYREIYAGVELVFYGNERQLEYDFNVAPYADPSQIKLNFRGADNLSIDDNGDLIAKLAGKDVKFSAPVAYQNINGERRAVTAEYLINEPAKISFVLGEYDQAETLVIDPILEYASYLGGSTNDSANAIVVNAAGEAYVAGETSSPNFPIVNAIQPNKFDTTDAFLTKFNASGSGVVFSTYLGGTGVQAINNLALDANNNIAIAGIDQRNNFDAFVGKLNAAGNALVYPTIFRGGSGEDSAGGVAVDAAGNAYITGITASTNFPTTPGVIQVNDGPGAGAFAVRVNANGAIAYSTYLDGAEDNFGNDIAVDGAGNAYIVGEHGSLPNSSGFILKLNATGSGFGYPTFYFGGSGREMPADVEIDGSGNAYIGGDTTSSDFPVTAGVIQSTRGGGYDGFVAKVNPAGNGLVWASYLGGISDESVVALALDSAGGIYVTGNHRLTGDSNYYVAHLNSTASALDYNAQFGGRVNGEGSGVGGDDYVYALAVDPNDNVYVTGFTVVNDFPTTAGAFDRTYNGSAEGFVMKIAAPINGGSSQTIVTNVTVAGTNVGVNGGVTNPQVTIQPNDFVKIEAIGGIVNFNTHATKTICQPVAYEVGPLGRPRPDLFDEGNPCYDGERIDCQVNTNDPMPSRNHAGLFRPSQAGIGGIKWIGAGTDTFMYTGTSNTTLKLGVNDVQCGVSPNSGSFNVRITVVRPAATTLNINVPGNSVPNNEKFVAQLNAGDEVTINNISGQVNFDPIDNQNGCPYLVNANGLDRAIYGDPGNQLLCYNSEWTPNDPLQGGSHGHAGLFMMRGAAKTFIGLNGSTFTASADQPLYLGINDAGNATNTGSFNARVIINRATTVEPTLSVNTVTVQEGNAGTTNAVFTVSLSPAADETVTVRYQTADGTAIAGQDYTATGNTLTFAPGEISKTVTVPIIGDLTDEPDEYFTLQLINPTGAQTVFPRGRANITDDDIVPSISVTDATVTEGNSGTVNANFAVSLSGISGNTVTVNYATANGTATAPGDYTARTDTLTFAPGETSKLVTIAVVGDTLVEANETFNLNLSGAVNATIADATGLGTITNDDVGGSIQFSASAVSVNEGAGTVILTVNRTDGAASGVTVNYATQNGTATAGQDYTTTNGVLSFGAGEASKPITVPITNDTSVEGNETFSVNLSSPAGGATLGSPASVTVTIVDNDTCTYSISPGAQSFAVGGGTGSINVTAPAGCGWTATESAAWITITGGASGSGNGTVSFTVAANTGAARNDTITAAGQAFAVTQAGVATTRRTADFDGDGRSDVSVFRPSTAVWHLNQSTNGYTGVAFGLSTDRLAAADYDGDGKTDIGVFRPSTGTWYLLRSTLGFTGIAFGQNGDIPAPADYDGDGKADLAVFRPSTGTWYLLRSTLGSTGIAFGQNGDIPVAGDYDDDGKSDVAVFRAGVWYILRSTFGFTGAQFGTAGDKPVVGDYDGDRKVDLTVYRPSNGTWYLLRSTAGFTGIQFGVAEDIPVEGDYDGDAKSDLGVFRPSTSTWYLLRSTAGLIGLAFGTNGDLPVPSKAGQ